MTTLESNRREAWRQAFQEAVADYAAAVAELRRAEFDRGKLRVTGSGDAEREIARRETYRLRAEAFAAYFRVRLLADLETDRELLTRAEGVIDLCRLITADTMTLAQLEERSRDVASALDAVLDGANERIASA